MLLAQRPIVFRADYPHTDGNELGPRKDIHGVTTLTTAHPGKSNTLSAENLSTWHYAPTYNRRIWEFTRFA